MPAPLEHFRPPVANPNCLTAVFDAKVCRKGGILRRVVAEEPREVARNALVSDVRRRGWHQIQIGNQDVVFCHTGDLRILC